MQDDNEKHPEESQRKEEPPRESQAPGNGKNPEQARAEQEEERTLRETVYSGREGQDGEGSEGIEPDGSDFEASEEALFPLACMGASAGGLEALKDLLPVDEEVRSREGFVVPHAYHGVPS